MRRRALVLLAAWAVATATILAIPGCYGNNCLGSTSSYGMGPGEGRMIDEDTWESSPQDGEWIPFPGARTVFFNVSALGDRKPQLILPYISPVADPNVAVPGRATNFTLGGGNLSELSGIGPNRFAVRNGSCADYFLRVVVTLEPRPPGPGLTLDAGGDDAGADAGTDAEADAALGAPTDAATDGEAGP